MPVKNLTEDEATLIEKIRGRSRGNGTRMDADRFKSSIEVGKAGQRVKIYFDPSQPEEAEAMVEVAVTMRAKALQMLTRPTPAEATAEATDDE